MLKYSQLSGASKVVAGMFVGITLYAVFGPEPEPEYRDVIVTQKQIVEVERVDTLIQWKERIVYKTVQAEQVATATGGAVSDVERFCAESVPGPADSTEADSSSTPAPPVLLLRSMRLEDAWFFGKDRLILTGPLSNGDLRQTTHRTRGSVQAHVHGDSVIVQFPRSALVKQGIEYGSVALLFYLIGSVF